MVVLPRFLTRPSPHRRRPVLPPNCRVGPGCKAGPPVRPPFPRWRHEPNRASQPKRSLLEPGSNAAIKSDADLARPDTRADEAKATADESLTAPAVATDRVADQSEIRYARPTRRQLARHRGHGGGLRRPASTRQLPPPHHRPLRWTCAAPANEQGGRGDAKNHATRRSLHAR